MPGGPDQPGPAVCRTCGYRLNTQTLYEGDVLVEVGWLHGYEADHDPDPQPVQALPVSAMVCDFCGLPGPVWSIDTDRDILIQEVRETARGPSEEAVYYLAGHDQYVAGDSVVSLDKVRHAAREFLTNGGKRPTCVEWQPHNPP